MIVTKYITIVNMTMPSSWIALVTAFVIAYAAIRIRYGKRISGVLVDSIFYFILVWKLSVIVTDFGHVIKSPLSIIYFNGGQIGFYLGLLAAGITILIELKKNGLHKLERIALFTGFVTIQAVYQIMIVLLNEGPFIAKIVTIVMFTMFALYVWILFEYMNGSLIQLGLLFTVVHLFVASFQPVGILGTSVIATLLISLFSVLVLFKGLKTGLEETL